MAMHMHGVLSCLLACSKLAIWHARVRHGCVHQHAPLVLWYCDASAMLARRPGLLNGALFAAATILDVVYTWARCGIHDRVGVGR
jgi:hypothetical protein